MILQYSLLISRPSYGTQVKLHYPVVYFVEEYRFILVSILRMEAVILLQLFYVYVYILCIITECEL